MQRHRTTAKVCAKCARVTVATRRVKGPKASEKPQGLRGLCPALQFAAHAMPGAAEMVQSFLFGGPVGRLVVAGHGQEVGLRAVGKHGPDLALAVAGGFEDDVAAVGSPTGALVLAAVAGDLTDLASSGIHDVDVEIAVRAAPTEGDHLAVGRPRRVDQIAFVGKSKFAGVGAVGVHEVELGNTSAIANEYDALAGLGVPCWRSAGGVGKGDALGAAAVGVDDEEFGITEHG